MSDEITFTDNEEISAEDINNIAVDLGDTEFSQFSNEKFGVDKLNEITKDLVTAGILKTKYDDDDNLIMGCNAVVSANSVIIGSGVIVFSCGAKSRISEPKQQSLENNTYIYAVFNADTAKAYIEQNEELPQGDVVPICYISDGTIEDMRQAPRAKLDLTADTPNTYAACEGSLNAADNGTPETCIHINTGFSAYKYFLLKIVHKGSNVYTSYGENLITPSNATFSRIILARSGYGTTYTLYIRKNGQFVDMYLTDTATGYKGSVLNVEFEVI